MKTSRLIFGTFALLATAGVPICASAATLGPEPITVSIPSDTPVFLSETLDTSTFNQFNPSLGTLTSVTATLGGEVDWQVNFLPISPIFDTLTVTFLTTGTNPNQTTDHVLSAPQTVPVTVNLTDTFSSPLTAYEGTGKNFLTVEFDDLAPLGNFINSTDGLSGSITYTYTPATPLPAALPLFASGIGGLGLLGWRRKRKAKAGA